MNKKVIVTTSWDDGHKLDLKLAKLLKKYGIKGTFYISQDNREFNKSDLLSDKEIVNLARDFEIGAHTQTHPRLTEIDEVSAYEEIAESKTTLEKLLHIKIKCFCYPGGDVNSKIEEMVIKTGFKMARTVMRYSFDYPVNPFECATSVHAYNHLSDIFRILIYSDFNPFEFIKNLRWDNLAIKMFDNTVQNGGVFHLWGHSWEIEKRQYWEKLERVFKYISNNNQVDYVENSRLIKA